METMQKKKPFEIVVIPAKVSGNESENGARQIRVAAYCRVSTDLEEQQSSFVAQRDYYTDKILTNPKWSLRGIFADDGDIIGLNQKTFSLEVLPIKSYFLPYYPNPIYPNHQIYTRKEQRRWRKLLQL